MLGLFITVRFMVRTLTAEYLQDWSQHWIFPKSLNNTYINIIKTLNKIFKKVNIIESQNLVVRSTLKKGNFKSVGKFTSVT